MAITDPRAIAFVNVHTRPMAELLRNLKAVATDMDLVWNNGVSDLFVGPPGAVVDDGRAAEGVSILTAGDVVNLQAQVQAILTSFRAVGVMDVITKPTVRPLRGS